MKRRVVFFAGGKFFLLFCSRLLAFSGNLEGSNPFNLAEHTVSSRLQESLGFVNPASEKMVRFPIPRFPEWGATWLQRGGRPLTPPPP